MLNAKTPSGDPIVQGRTVTGFSNPEEAAVELTDVVPFLLEDELTAKGGHYRKVDDWQAYAVQDGMLITGQTLSFSGDYRGLSAILYLAVFGSLLGFYCYYQVLARLPAATVALVTLITPVLALSLGSLFNGESLGALVLAGAALIVLALSLFLLGDHKVRRQLKQMAESETATTPDPVP